MESIPAGADEGQEGRDADGASDANPPHVVEVELREIVVVRTPDHAHRVEIYANPLGEYSATQTRLTASGRTLVSSGTWGTANLDVVSRGAKDAIDMQLKLDALNPVRREGIDLDAPNLKTQEHVSKSGVKAVDEYASRQRRCGHPTQHGACGHRVTGPGPCAAGHQA